MFTPKTGESGYTEANVYLPVSLSFLFRTMQKLVDGHIRDEIFKVYPLHRNQFVTRNGKYTETVLHNMVMCTESAVEHTKTALGVSLIHRLF
jgi:hypothetical protein